MDLNRVAVGYYRGSVKTAERFMDEALKRRIEVDEGKVKPYLRKFIKTLPDILDKKNKKRVAEDALMYSIIFQNYALKY